MNAPRRAMGPLTNAVLLMIGAGCGPGAEPHTAARGDPTPWVTCAPDGIGRIRCTSTIDTTLTLVLPSGTVERDLSPGSPLTARFLPPEHTIPWFALGSLEASGTVSTAPLPPSVDLRVAIEGALGQRHLLLPTSCGLLPEPWLAILDTHLGRVVWAESPAMLAGLPHTDVTGFTRHPDGSLWTILGHDAVVGFDLEGDLLQTWTHPEDLVNPVHHDLAWADDTLLGLDAALHHVDGRDVVLDGVVALSSDGADRVWDLADHVVPTGTPAESGAYWSDPFGAGAIDWSHANGITHDGDGWLVSLRHLDAVIRVDQATGALDWILSAGDSPLGPGLSWRVPDGVAPGLRGPHHPTRTLDDRLLLMDNGRDRDSRILVVAIDPIAGVAHVDQAYPLDRACPFQGGAYELADGTILGTCPSERRITAFDPDGTVRGTAHITCESGRIGTPPLRAVPVTMPEALIPVI